MERTAGAEAVVLPATEIGPIPDVVDRARAGDRAAFAEIYETHVDQVYRYILYRLRKPADAEDLTSEVFTRAFASIHRYRWQGKSLLAWLYTIARNAITDLRRRQRPMINVDTAFGLAWNGPTAHEQVIHREDVAALKNAITRLTNEQRAVLRLRFVEGLPSAQVAERQGRKEGAVRALQFRAVARLRKMMPG